MLINVAIMIVDIILDARRLMAQRRRGELQAASCVVPMEQVVCCVLMMIYVFRSFVEKVCVQGVWFRV